MPLVFRCQIDKENCFLCSHYHPSPTLPYQGSCQYHAPSAEAGIGPGATEGEVFPFIFDPGVTTCGDFKPWERNGTDPRQQGSCFR